MNILANIGVPMLGDSPLQQLVWPRLRYRQPGLSLTSRTCIGWFRRPRSSCSYLHSLYPSGSSGGYFAGVGLRGIVPPWTEQFG